MDNASSGIETTREFFDRFLAAFATFDGQIVADLFAAPGAVLAWDLLREDDSTALRWRQSYNLRLRHACGMN